MHEDFNNVIPSTVKKMSTNGKRRLPFSHSLNILIYSSMGVYNGRYGDNIGYLTDFTKTIPENMGLIVINVTPIRRPTADELFSIAFFTAWPEL